MKPGQIVTQNGLHDSKVKLVITKTDLDVIYATTFKFYILNSWNNWDGFTFHFTDLKTIKIP